MTQANRRGVLSDRRRVPRGGRRAVDQPGRFPNVLVADSYDGARTPCVRYLNQLGFCVMEASGGNEALRHLEAMTPQLILIENGLPNAPVLDIARRLSESSKTVPLIVMTSALDDTAETVALLPLVSVLQKPFSLATMLEEIRRLLATPSPPLADAL
jgi:DNA-binding response OmpR family regulator